MDGKEAARLAEASYYNSNLLWNYVEKQKSKGGNAGGQSSVDIKTPSPTGPTPGKDATPGGKGKGLAQPGPLLPAPGSSPGTGTPGASNASPSEQPKDLTDE